MTFSRTTSDQETPASIHSALGDVVTHGHQLLINRLDLLQVELRDIGHRAVTRGTDIALGVLLAFAGFVLLTVSAVLFLSLYIGAQWACLVGGATYLLAGVGFVLRSRNAAVVDVTTALVPDVRRATTEGRYAD